MTDRPQEGFTSRPTEGSHVAAGDEDDVEGHGMPQQGFTSHPQEGYGGRSQEGFRVQLTDEEDDVEGHAFNIIRSTGGE
jgi:hypothetical protein